MPLAARVVLVMSFAYSLSACASVRRTHTTAPELLLIPAAIANAAELAPRMPLSIPAGIADASTATLLLRVDVGSGDRAIAERMGATPFGAASSRATLVIFGGAGRAATSVLHVLALDTLSTARATAEVVAAAVADSSRVLIIAVPDATARDVAAMLDGVAAFAAAARAAGVPLVAALAPAGDTAAYPTRELASIVDLFFLLPASPRPLARPAAPLTAASLRRAVGPRAATVGAARVLLLLPLHGYAWATDSASARAISYAEAVELAAQWHAPFTRDPDSRMLRARSTETGEIWVPDAETIAHLLHEMRLMGVRRFALVTGAGEDPRIWSYIATEGQSTSSSR